MSTHSALKPLLDLVVARERLSRSERASEAAIDKLYTRYGLELRLALNKFAHSIVLYDNGKRLIAHLTHGGLITLYSDVQSPLKLFIELYEHELSGIIEESQQTDSGLIASFKAA